MIVKTRSANQVNGFLSCIKKMPSENNINVDSPSTSMEELIGALAQLSIAIAHIQATLVRMDN